MALPTTITDDRSPSRQAALYGAPLIIGPASPEFDIEVWRAPDALNNDPGSFTLRQRIRIPDPQGGLWIDPLPNSPTFYHYKIRHVRRGFQDGPFLDRIIRRRAERILAEALAGRPLAVPAVAHTAEIAGAPALPIARGGHGVFLETYDKPIDHWFNVSSGVTLAGVESYPLDGLAGGRVYQTTGYRWRRFPGKIPFDPSKLYRMRVRVRRTVDAGAGAKAFYCGVAGFAADGLTMVNANGVDSDSSQHYICASGVDQEGWAVNTWMDFTGWFRGYAASVGATTPSTDPRVPRELHPDVRYISPLQIVNYQGLVAGDTVQIDEMAIDVFDEEGQSRTYETILGAGVLDPITGQSDGTATRRLMKGMQKGTARDTDGITFAQPFQSVPDIEISDGLTISYEPRPAQWAPGFVSTNPQTRDFAALNPTTTGFTQRALMRQTGTPTPRAVDFAAVQLDVPGETDVSPQLGNAPANNDTYIIRVYWRIELSSKFGNSVSLIARCAIDVNDGSGYVQREEVVAAAETSDLGTDVTTGFFDVPVIATGLDNTDLIRLRYLSQDTSGNPDVLISEFRGADNTGSFPGRGVSWNTATDNTASATPDAGHFVRWIAKGYL